MELLISQEVDIDSQSKFKWTPLMQACTRGHLEVCLLLLSAGVNHDIKNSDGLTAILLPNSKGFHGMVELLTTYGAVHNTQDNIGNTSLKLSEK